jgi:hypothetical protein
MHGGMMHALIPNPRRILGASWLLPILLQVATKWLRNKKASYDRLAELSRDH